MNSFVHKHVLAVSFGPTGFAVGWVLFGYSFYLTSHHLIGSTALFLVLCPPSIGAMALDNASAVGGTIGWCLISFVNGALYLAIGAFLDYIRSLRRN